MPTLKKDPAIVSEAQWQSSVEHAARLFGWSLYHTRDSRGSERGFPDIVAIRGQRLLFAELKVGAARLRPEQRHWLELLRLIGRPVEIYVWRFPHDWDTVIETLRPVGSVYQRDELRLMGERW